MDRTQRQRLCIRRWLDCNGKGIIEACTGFGDYRNFYYICSVLNNLKYLLWNKNY